MNLLRVKGRSNLIIVFLSLIFSVVFSFGCGGSSYPLPNRDTSTLNPGERIIMSELYAGYLVLHLDESIGTRLDSSKSLFSTQGQSDPLVYIQNTIDSHVGASIRRSVDIEPAKLDALRNRLQKSSGKNLADFNSIYKIDVADPDEALSLYNALLGKIGVKKVYPAQKSSVSGIIDVPDLTGHQGYLYPESTHSGLNAEAAWTAGITGQNVRVLDMEYSWNYDHEDLSLTSALQACDLTATDDECLKAIAHGTCVAGIIGSLHNGHGTDGFSPDADLGLRFILHVDHVDSAILQMLDGDESDGEMYPGTIMLIEIQTAGLLNPSSCSADPYGCVPTSIIPLNHDAIEYAIASDITVIEGGGNGSVDLGNPANYGTVYTNISTNDSGSIIVGASLGASKEIASFSNWGSRVDVFAWGAGVATTSFPSSLPLDWYGTTSPIPPNDETNIHYTDNFGGTSAATAMIAGAASLVQSYAKQELVNVETRYIMPLKMREILADSGVPQSGSGGNIGMQPRVDEAMGLVDTLVASVYAAYPELTTNDVLTETQYTSLRAMGVGLNCYDYDTVASDPSCPDSELFPEGTKISNAYDFDGDDRADLVKFSNGAWSIDLSGTGSTDDGYGAWDVSVSFTPLPGDVVWPYVADMNSDGRSDLVAYDKLNGTFYVHLTDSDLVRDSIWHGWDWIIDYSSEWHDEYTADPDDADYSRPFIARYNDDVYLDIGVACSDGFVRVDYGDGTETGFSSFEWSSQLLTDEMLAQAPGWAYLPSPNDFNSIGMQFFGVKVPDTSPDEGRMYIIPHDGVNFLPEWDWMESSPHIFGGNDHIPISARFDGSPTIGLKNGDWLILDDFTYDSLYSLSPTDIYGESDCHPVAGRFDSDGLDDRVVMCPDEWRIAYTTDDYDSILETDGARHIPLSYDKSEGELPGRSYAGGITYEYARQLMEQYAAMHPGDPVPILVDMVTVSTGP